LPDFEKGHVTATTLLAAHTAEWRMPLGPWRARAAVNDTGEPLADEDEETD